ncbi:MAG: peptidase C15 [Bosea sp. (in: a-proteobacteria)]
MVNTRKGDILVTGFGPFPHVRINPTALLAREVARKLYQRGILAKLLVLETSYAGGLPALSAAIERERPRAVLMLGLAGRARGLRVEMLARTSPSPLHVDATGKLPKLAPVDATAKSALPSRSTANTQSALATLRGNGLRAQLSPSAGRYLCNASYALALAHPALKDVPVLFVHIPWLRPVPGTRRKDAVSAWRPGFAPLAVALAELASVLKRHGI